MDPTQNRTDRILRVGHQGKAFWASFMHTQTSIGGLCLVLGLAMPIQPPGGPPTTPGTDKPKAQEHEIEKVLIALIDEHNKQRNEHQLHSLVRNKKLDAVAFAHAKDMAEHEKMSHEGSDGSKPPERLKKAGYNYLRMGENIAYGQKTPEEVIKLWMESPVHRDHILGGFTEIGVGLAKAEDGTRYWCVEFGHPQRH